MEKTIASINFPFFDNKAWLEFVIGDRVPSGVVSSILVERKGSLYDITVSAMDGDLLTQEEYRNVEKVLITTNSVNVSETSIA